MVILLPEELEKQLIVAASMLIVMFGTYVIFYYLGKMRDWEEPVE